MFTTDKLEVGKAYKSKGGTLFKVVRKFAENDVWGMVADNGIVLQVSNNSEYEPMPDVKDDVFKPKNDAQILKEIKKKKQKLGVEMPPETPVETAKPAPAPATSTPATPAPEVPATETKAAKEASYDEATCKKVYDFLKGKFTHKEKSNGLQFVMGTDKMIMYDKALVLRTEIDVPNTKPFKTFNQYKFYNFEDVKAFLGYV